MKILLLGGTGQLGRTFVDQGGLAARGTLTVASRDGSHGEVAELTEPASLFALLDRVQPDLIVNAAAYTAVDRAEQEEALARRVNAEAVGVIGNWASAHGSMVLHYSTDYVFDGSQSQPYAVDAPTGPLGAYGRSKLAGELALRDSGADYLTFRTAWVYAAHGQNFLRTMLRQGAQQEELRVVDDQHGAPTDTTLIVEASLAALESWQNADNAKRDQLRGIHHLVSSGATTWYGFASAILEKASALGLLSRRPRVVPVSSSEFASSAARPAWSLLDNHDFQRQFDFTMPHWQCRLDAVLRRLAESEH